MIRPIFTMPTGKLTLHAKCQKARYADEWYPVIQDLKDTLDATHNALGLAAPQIGLLLRIFVVRDGTRILTFINPELIEADPEMDIDKEGCLSLPGCVAIVSRPKWARILSWAEDRKYTGALARCVLHELDHLDGILITDREAEQARERKARA